jgi:hypothetical protein
MMKLCPLIGMKKCLGEKCMWWGEIETQNPVTQEKTKSGNCAMAWLPVLLIEGNHLTMSHAKSTETTRDDITKRQDAMTDVFSQLVKIARRPPTLTLKQAEED